MGVPKFFRWISERYPAILSDIISEANPCPPVDMLFLDMNGIIHHCSHSDDQQVRDNGSVTEVVKRMEATLLFIIEELARPTTLIYFAIDGVAPRAKLNQQRARRYRAAKDGPKGGGSFDSNCITPGTLFMQQISLQLLQFIHKQKQISSYWNSLNIVFSGSEVPGEGEHKIISYIREMKEQYLLSPNSKYCLYGADADMIMLALATHEPYMIVLREINQIDTSSNHRQQSNGAIGGRKPMQFIRINVLREYLYSEFSQDLLLNLVPNEEELNWGDEDGVEVEDEGIVGKGNPQSPSSTHSQQQLEPSRFEEEGINLERLIDDFIFLTFLVGNDFLPHLPGLDIGDNAFDIIFDAYKTVFSTSPGYVVTNAKLDYKRLELIFSIIGSSEAVIFEEKQLAQSYKDRSKFKSFEVHSTSSPANGKDGEDGTTDKQLHPPSHLHQAEASLPPSDTGSSSSVSSSLATLRQRYYLAKFGFDPDQDNEAGIGSNPAPAAIPASMKVVVKEYLQGLEWCLAYYSKGCISWDWFYPFHYGPFLQDMQHLREASSTITFVLNQPLLPFQQLLACLPPQSVTLLPTALRHLMYEGSPLIEFYPRNFETDMNGKKRDYEAVVLLPFIDIRLLTEISSNLWELLTPEEQERNEFGKVHYFMPYQPDEQLFDFKITPSESFKSELIPGTLDQVEGFPTAAEVQSIGKSLYFIRGSGRGRGGRGGGRGRGRGYQQR